jgi:hypothetical protein
MTLDARAVIASLSAYRREAMRRDRRAKRWLAFLFVVRCFAVAGAWALFLVSLFWVLGVIVGAAVTR